MTKFPSIRDRDMLQAYSEPFCVTIYLPFIAPNAATNPNVISYKNALRKATTLLEAAGATGQQVKKTLRPAQRLIARFNEFWPPRHEGLALFAQARLFRHYHVPGLDVPPTIVVEHRFELGPLDAVLRANHQYLVLALDHKDVRLFAGDRYTLREVKLRGFPMTMEETLHIDEYPSQRELHGVAPAYLGKGSEGYHSQYNVAEVDKQMLEEFFRIVDRRLHRYLETQHKQLLLAGVEYLAPIYRKVNTYRNLYAETITGSTRRLSCSALQRKAWSLLYHTS